MKKLWMISMGVLGCATVALASTSDGETPAEESVCDEYAGASYGLCVAYCEATDCDGDPEASEQACTRMAERFEALTAEPIRCATCPPAGESCFDSAMTHFEEHCVPNYNEPSPDAAACVEESRSLYYACLQACPDAPAGPGVQCWPAGWNPDDPFSFWGIYSACA